MCYNYLQYSVQQYAVQVSSLGAIGYTTLPRCVVGHTVYVCVSTLCDVRTTTKSPNDAFLRRYPVVKRRISVITAHCETQAKHQYTLCGENVEFIGFALTGTAVN